MTETFAQAVERLRKNTKPYGLLSEDDRKFLLEIGPTNLQIFSYVRIWQEIPTKSYSAGTFNESLTYRIRPDYQPEPPKPEYVDCDITENSCGELLCSFPSPLSGNYGSRLISVLPAIKTFAGFWRNEKKEPEKFNIWTHYQEVAQHRAEGKNVVARFERRNP
jgi:hypothetical protein